MQEEFSIKEEVYKCSKCGLCQSICPIYLATKNEMYLARGRYIILNNFFNNNRPLSKQFIKNLDICLNCNACKDFCPSNIDMTEINVKLKNQYSKKLIPFSFMYKIILNLHKPFNIRKTYKLKNTGTKGNVLYFEGCYNKFINSSDKNASLELIESQGYKVTKIISECCGYPQYNEGNFSDFEKNAKKIEKICTGDFAYIVCSCDSCYRTLKKALPIELSEKLITIDELLKVNNYEIISEGAYHKPFSRENDCYLPKRVETINKKDTCCFMENFFLLKHPKIAKKLHKYTQDDIKKRTLFTTCNLAKWGLSKTLKTNVLSYSEFIIKKIS